MPMLFFSSRRAPAIAAALLFALAVSGCASRNPFAPRNPLIDDEPAPVATAKTEKAPAESQAEAHPAKPVLPKPVLVVKPPAEPKPAAEAKPPAEAKPAPAPESAKPAALVPPSTVPSAPASQAAADPAPVPASVATTAAVAPAVSTDAAVPAAPVLVPQPVADMSKQAPTGAQRWLGIFKPYKINIQQGNFISQDMVAKLRPGMTKEQVRFVLGTPLLTDLFHADRWDYLFRLQKPDGSLTTNRIAVFFRDNRVERIQSSDLPSENEYLSHIFGPADSAKQGTLPAKPAAPAPQPSTKP